MGKIKVLSDTLISQIAAGEVVERPASVVKELVENSLDAGAAFCSIEAEQGGMKLISVRDNGCGMDAKDALLAFERHATSKIASFDDLSNIRSFGFRGEALAAIASVALVTLKSRQADSDHGSEIIFKGGELESQGVAGCPAGTEVIVRNLFFNTPARRKFLKSETTELSHITAVISHMAIAYPSVGFEFKHNGKIIISVPQGSLERLRMAAVLGRNFLEESIPVSFKTESIHIHGYIGQPGMAMSSKRHQYIFVNGRDVSDALVARAVCDAYGSRLPGRSYPMFILHIDISPADVDVNVHPRKLAVKFLEPQRIYRDISQAVSQALEEHQNKLFIAAPQSGGSVASGQNAQSPAVRGATVQDAMSFTKNFTQDQAKRPGGLGTEARFNILGQIADSYILIIEEEGISIVDQHAAHERILYEKFKASAVAKEPNSQSLLVPLNIECSREEAVFLKEAMPHLKKMGFEFDEWSGGTFQMRACPSGLKSENLHKIFKDFLAEAGGKAGGKILPEKILKSLACKAAVKFGMPLSRREQEELLLELTRTKNNSTCPHGRPVKVSLTFEELERKFYRK